MAFLIPAVIALVCDGAVLSLHRMGRHQDDHGDESNPDSTTTQGTQITTTPEKDRRHARTHAHRNVSMLLGCGAGWMMLWRHSRTDGAVVLGENMRLPRNLFLVVRLPQQPNRQLHAHPSHVLCF